MRAPSLSRKAYTFCAMRAPILGSRLFLARFPLFACGDTRKQESSPGCLIRRNRTEEGCSQEGAERKSKGRGRSRRRERLVFRSFSRCAERHGACVFSSWPGETEKMRNLREKGTGRHEKGLSGRSSRSAARGALLLSCGGRAALCMKSVNQERQKSSLHIGGN